MTSKYHESLARRSRQLIQDALLESGGCVSAAAAGLGLSRRAIYTIADRIGLDLAECRRTVQKTAHQRETP